MNPDIERILNNFSTDFNYIYKKITGRQRKEIAYLAPSIFVRWYYSAIFAETILSPATIIESQSENIVKSEGFYSYCLHENNLSGDELSFSFKKEFYSIENHPIYNDIYILADYITPTLNINNDFSLKESDIHKLQFRLSISDKYYVTYLFSIMIKIGIIKSIPSLYDTYIQIDRNNDYWNMSANDKFDIIIKYSSQYCADILNQEFSYDLCQITSETIIEFASKPLSIDDMFIRIFGNIGIDLDYLWHKSDNDELSEDESSILSSIFYMGILMDKAFIFVFGHYLRIIRPIYSFPIKFKEVINSLFNAITIDGEIDLEIFLPCTTYTLTPLGRIYFDVSTKEKSTPPIPIDKISESIIIERANQLIVRERELAINKNKKIYTFKVILNRDINLWKKIEIEGTTNIEQLFSQLILIFALPQTLNYKFKVKSKSKVKTNCISFDDANKFNNPNLKIDDFNPENKNNLFFSMDNNITIDLNFVKIDKAINEFIYPRIIDQSKKLTENEHYIFARD